MEMGMGRRGVRILEDGREWRLPGLMYADDLALCGEENLIGLMERFAEVCRKSGLNVNSGKSKVMVLNGED